MKKLPIIAGLLALGFNAGAQKREVKIFTPYGKMIVALSDETPAYRDNFVKLVKKRFYDGLLFHRVIRDFMIQGGDPNSRHASGGQALGDGDVGYTIPADFVPDLFHRKGALAAARQGDMVNPQKASSGCQFYIVEGKTYTAEQLSVIQQRTGHVFTAEERKVYETQGGTPFLDGSYTVFGQVVQGMAVLDSIARVPTDGRDRPVRDVPMKIRLVHKFLFF
jgi:peptidyl-prolyl cis-trans isomerase B (cyclophilin B)